MKTFVKDKLEVEIFENRTLMGEAAAKDISAKRITCRKAGNQYDICSRAVAKRRSESVGRR